MFVPTQPQIALRASLHRFTNAREAYRRPIEGLSESHIERWMRRFQEVKLGSYGQGGGTVAQEAAVPPIRSCGPEVTIESGAGMRGARGRSGAGAAGAAGAASVSASAAGGVASGDVAAVKSEKSEESPVAKSRALLPGSDTPTWAFRGPYNDPGTWQAPPVSADLSTRHFPVYTNADERFVMAQHQRWSRVAAWLRTSVAAESALRSQYVLRGISLRPPLLVCGACVVVGILIAG